MSRGQIRLNWTCLPLFPCNTMFVENQNTKLQQKCLIKTVKLGGGGVMIWDLFGANETYYGSIKGVLIYAHKYFLP